ncbi:hypothetical protein [Bacillus massiliglaciei]|uniref:hypothetical protein n=1 Tax=Bacillus massiliglaciei TaxID=1816693 RepID=UPI000A6B6655|nr:hypothetical protein [Bacillus massiliglaciei]
MEANLVYAEEWKSFFNPEDQTDADMVQAALELYFQELVYDKKREDGFDYITATVQDIQPYQVTIDITSPLGGSCSGNETGICRHQLALFFSVYSEQASVFKWVNDWKISRSSENALPADLGIKRASEILKEQTEEKTALGRDYSSWKSFVRRTFEEQITPKINLPVYLLEDHLRSYFKKLQSKAPMETEWRSLYQFTTLFCTFLETAKLIQLHDKEPQSVRFFYSLANDLADEAHELIRGLSRQARPFAFDPFVSSIKDDVAQLLQGEDGLEYERVDLYRELWSYLFTKPEWRGQELERILNQRSKQYPGTVIRNSHTLAAIHLFLLEGQDAQAIELLKELPEDHCPYIFYWLNFLEESRTIPFIEYINSHIKAYLARMTDYYKRVDFVRTFTSPVTSISYKLKRTDLLDKFYKAALPHSYWNYANFLFEQRQYKKWVEMHIFSEISIDLISNDSIKTIVSEQPELILPLYYHAVQEKVSLKNRPAYKQAVRYLKKMRTIHKKLKEEEKFEKYLEYVTDSTKRLRAFQEELKRGKLIDV